MQYLGEDSPGLEAGTAVLVSEKPLAAHVALGKSLLSLYVHVFICEMPPLQGGSGPGAIM